MGERRAATAGLPWAAWASAMARSSWSWVCARGAAGPVAALTSSPGRRAEWPPRVRWPGRLTLAAARRAARTACRPPGPRARRPHRGRRRLAACPGTTPAAPRASAPAGDAGQMPSPRCPGPVSPSSAAGARIVSRLMPAGRVRAGCDTGPGTCRLPPAVAPGHRRARGRDPVARLLHARAARTWAWCGMGGRHLCFHRHGQAGPSPPAPAGCAGQPRSCGDGPSGLGPARHRLMSGCAVTGAGLSGAGFPWLPRGPGSGGLAPGHPRGCRMAWPSVSCLKTPESSTLDIPAWFMSMGRFAGSGSSRRPESRDACACSTVMHPPLSSCQGRPRRRCVAPGHATPSDSGQRDQRANDSDPRRLTQIG